MQVFATESPKMHAYAQSHTAVSERNFSNPIILLLTTFIRYVAKSLHSFIPPPKFLFSSKMAALLALLFLTSMLSIRLAHAQTKCAPELMGYPQGRDCMALIQKVPFAVGAPWQNVYSTRAFVEPQFLVNPFSPVRNPHPEDSMIQLPKIWRHCR